LKFSRAAAWNNRVRFIRTVDSKLIHYISCVACMYLGQLVENYRIEQKNILEDVIQIFSSCLGCKVWEGRTVRRKRERSVCSCIWKKINKVTCITCLSMMTLANWIETSQTWPSELDQVFPKRMLRLFYRVDIVITWF